MGECIHGAGLRRQRSVFWNARNAEGKRDADAQVEVESMLWWAERNNERLMRTEALYQDPAESQSRLMQGRYEELKRALSKPQDVQAFEAFLRRGRLPNMVYAWYALEIFRTRKLSKALQQSSCEEQKIDTAIADQNRRDACLIFDLFCRENGPLYTPTGFNTYSMLDQKIWGSPEHINVGHNLFSNMQSKIMVELERQFLPSFLVSRRYRAYSANECVTVIPHASLLEVLNNTKTRKIFESHLKTLEKVSFCSVIHADQVGKASSLVSFWASLNKYRAMEPGKLKRKQSVSIIRNFLEEPSVDNASIRNLLGNDLEAQIELIRATLQTQSTTGHLMGEKRGGSASCEERERKISDGDCEEEMHFKLQSSTAFDDLAKKVYFELRNKYFSAFMRTTFYIKCLSVLCQVPVDELHRCIENLGKPLCSEEELLKLTNFESSTGPAAARLARSRVERAETSLQKNGSVFGFKSKLRKSTRIGLAPGLSNDEIKSQSKVNASPRDWERAVERRCCEWILYPQRDIADARVYGSKNQFKRICLGMEGVLRHSGLKYVFATFVRESYGYEGKNATELLDFFLDVEYLLESTGHDDVLGQLAHVYETYLKSTTSRFSKFCHGAQVENFEALIRPIRQAVTLSRAQGDDDLREALQALSKLRFVAVNIMLRKFWLPFRAVQKLETLLPGLFSL